MKHDALPISRFICDADDVKNGGKLVEVGWCLNIGPLLELLITTHTREEPIFIEEIVGPKKIIQNFRQAMVVMVIGLVKVCQFVENHGYQRNMEKQLQ